MSELPPRLPEIQTPNPNEAIQSPRFGGVKERLGSLALKLSDTIHGSAKIRAEQLTEVQDKVGTAVIDPTKAIIGKQIEHVSDLAYGIPEVAVERIDQVNDSLLKIGTLKEKAKFKTGEFISEKKDEASTAVRGLRRLFVATKIAWRNETLNGRDGTNTEKVFGLKIWDRKGKHGLRQRDEIVKRSAADALYSYNADYQAERPPKPSHTTVWERKVNNRREVQQEKINRKRARQHDLTRTYGSDINMSNSERIRSGTSAPESDMFSRMARRAGASEFKRNERRITSGGRLHAVMGTDKLHRASTGTTRYGQSRTKRINNIQQKIDDDRKRLGRLNREPIVDNLGLNPDEDIALVWDDARRENDEFDANLARKKAAAKAARPRRIVKKLESKPTATEVNPQFRWEGNRAHRIDSNNRSNNQ